MATTKDPAYKPSLKALELSALRLRDPTEWRKQVEGAIHRCGSLRGAAKALGVSLGVLQRAVRDYPDLVEGLIWKEPGRPKKDTRDPIDTYIIRPRTKKR